MADDTVIAVEDLFPIPLAVMQPGTAAPVNLYIRFRQPAGVILYKRANAPLRDESRERLMAQGVQELYVHKKDEKAYYDYVEQNIHAIICDGLLPAGKASKLVYESSGHVMADTFKDPRSGRNMRRAQAMVEATVLSVLKDPEALWRMTAAAPHDYRTYTHCVHVSVFLVTACRDLLGITDKGVLQQIGLGGILHDIGKSQVPEEILNKPGRLTPAEFEKIKDHPALGVHIVKSDRGIPRSSVQIVHSHHEHYDGGGYPRGLCGEGIDRISRLATIVDVYDALTTNRVYAPAREPYQALELMLSQMAPQFDASLLRAFVRFLGPRQLGEGPRARWDSSDFTVPELVASGG